jgi:Tol biopolymer transport system component
VIATLTLPAQATDFEWAADGKSITFIDRIDGVENIFRQPFEGGKPQQVTHFADGQIRDHELSPDGKRLVLSRRTEHENLWLTEADADRPIQLTHFETGNLSSVDWVPPDGRRVLFLYGQDTSDVVLIKNFK